MHFLSTKIKNLICMTKTHLKMVGLSVICDLYMFYIYVEHIEVLALRKTGFGLFTFPYTGNVNKCAVEI